MKTLFPLLLLCCATLAAANGDLSQRYFNGVFAGDLSFMTALSGTPAANDPLFGQFEARFVEREIPDAWAQLDDEFARQALLLYRDYWIDSLLSPEVHDSRRKALSTALDTLLADHALVVAGDDAFERLETALHDRGHGFLGGRTPPLQEFMLWRDTTSETYEVELTDGMQQVTVHFIDDFVSLGWANFATFGHAGTGGWAKDDGLWCIRQHYPDLESEEFTIEYLRHEARHFADYGRFPGLPAADLEYRAKLTQLIYGRQMQADFLTEFRDFAVAEADAPHPLANWHVMNDLAEQLGASGWQADLAESHDPETIAQAAHTLLERNTRALSEAGDNVALGLIHPATAKQKRSGE